MQKIYHHSSKRKHSKSSPSPVSKRHNNSVSPRHSILTNHSQGKSTATTRGQSPAVTSQGQLPTSKTPQGRPAAKTQGRSPQPFLLEADQQPFLLDANQQPLIKANHGKLRLLEENQLLQVKVNHKATRRQSSASKQHQSDKTSARGRPRSSSTAYPTKRKMGSCPHEEDIVEEPKSSKKKSKATPTTTKKAVPRGHSQASSKANSTSHGTCSQEETQVPSSSLKRTKLHSCNVKKQISPKKKTKALTTEECETFSVYLCV
ncbi:hypothetical protein O181_083636 [Austropuccinia psidii MF-1]|uniref:Uncharacterized protein n=1 Tax=Austropuccinia psidii MF-1 TaxID=1389203 RepID=A0A9Q3FUY9_9BASI|nr:hypothetical protein [Austropuccinia psidii MF-1]